MHLTAIPLRYIAASDHKRYQDKMIRLETDRLIIRDHKESDLSDYHKWISDSDLMYYIDWKTSSVEESQKDLIETIKENTNPNRTNYFFAMLEKETKSYIGAVGFTIKSKKVNTGIAECGYFLMKKYWRKGIVVEAITKILEFAFEELNLHKMTASCDKENNASEKVMQKCGFFKEGELRKQKFHHNKWCDRLLYSILKEEWKN